MQIMYYLSQVIIKSKSPSEDLSHVWINAASLYFRALMNGHQTWQLITQCRA